LELQGRGLRGGKEKEKEKDRDVWVSCPRRKDVLTKTALRMNKLLSDVLELDSIRYTRHYKGYRANAIRSIGTFNSKERKKRKPITTITNNKHLCV
jgi:hypothetical protein